MALIDILLNSQPNIHFLLNFFIIIFLFSILKASSSSASVPLLNFSINFFDTNSGEIFKEDDAVISREGIELTMNLSDKKKNESIGRATYSKPLHLWDKASGNQTNFTTHFSLFVDAGGRNQYGDGVTFFLAPNGSRLDPETKSGGGLGLALNDSVALDFKRNNFVAVEFDTYSNPWDPPISHVGINIRSMESITNVSWPSARIDGNKTDVWINYDSSRKILEVKFTYVHRIGKSVVDDYLSTVVDLTDYLPEWVTFGFSASTGSFYEINRILSWEFNSTSDIVDNASSLNVEPAASPMLSEQSNNRKGLVAGLSVGGVVVCFLILGGGFFLFCLRRKHGNEDKTKDSIFDVSYGMGMGIVELRLDENQIRIVEWVWELYGMGKILEAADKKLGGDFNEHEMERLLIVGLWCVHPDKAFRPSIRQVVNLLLTSEAPLPFLPPEMPVPAYLSPPMKLSMSFLISTDDSKAVPMNHSTTSSSGASSSPSASLLLNTR